MVLEPRLVHVAELCRQCHTLQGPGAAMWPVTIGSTETYACTDCAWRLEATDGVV